MKCMLCESFSFTHICSTCQNTYLKPSLYKRKIQNVDVFSFYKYEDIKELLHTKHTELGYYIYSILAKNSFKEFAKNFEYQERLHSIAIDDHTRSGYSHTAILNKALESKNIKPLHTMLHAKNKVNYSGKSREFRLKNPRDFQLQKHNGSQFIIIDDIITTGTTLNEAISTLKNEQKEVIFCLTLADSSS